jgi:hypothetical protein
LFTGGLVIMFETWLTERGRSNTSGEPTVYAVSVSDRDGFLVHIRSFHRPGFQGCRPGAEGP